LLRISVTKVRPRGGVFFSQGDGMVGTGGTGRCLQFNIALDRKTGNLRIILRSLRDKLPPWLIARAARAHETCAWGDNIR
jgi:hypothetical protein